MAPIQLTQKNMGKPVVGWKTAAQVENWWRAEHKRLSLISLSSSHILYLSLISVFLSRYYLSPISPDLL